MQIYWTRFCLPFQTALYKKERERCWLICCRHRSSVETARNSQQSLIPGPRSLGVFIIVKKMKKNEEKTERNDNSSFFLFNEFSHGWKRRGSRNNTQYASILLLSFSFALCRLQGPIFYFIIFRTALFFDWWREITVFFLSELFARFFICLWPGRC